MVTGLSRTLGVLLGVTLVTSPSPVETPVVLPTVPLTQLVPSLHDLTNLCSTLYSV